MTRWVVGWGLRFRRLVLAAAVGVIVLGVVQVREARVDALPEYSRPTVEVQTEALGLSAAEVEQLITVPLEQDLLVGVAFLEEIESVSLPGLSSVVMTFEPGTDVLDARQVVQERLTQAVGIAGLPAVAKLPQMIQPLSTNSRVSMVKLSSETLSPIDMSVLARWVIAPRLMGVSGVANVAIWGNRDRQLQVLVDPERLRGGDVTLSEVIRTAGNSLEVSPLSYLEASTPGTGGFIDTANQRLNIFHEQVISTPEELAQVPLEGTDGAPVTEGGNPVLLGDVTDVVEGHQPLIGDTACAGGEQCLLLVVEKFPAANTAEVSAGVDDALTALAPGLADMRIDTSAYRPAAYVDEATQTVGWVLLASAILLVLVLLSLLDWRRALVAAGTITVSAGVAVLVLSLRDAPMDLLVVSGLVLGLTAIVDDAVNDVHGLSASLARAHGVPLSSAGRLSAVLAEVATASRRSVFYAVLVVAAIALPLFFLPGEAGAFLPPIALSYLLAVVASMVSALVVLPALCHALLSAAPASAGTPLSRRLLAGFDRAGARPVTAPGGAAALVAVLAVIGVILVPFLDTDMRPALKERDIVVEIAAPPGTSLPRMTELAADAVDGLTELPGVRTANAQLGRAVMSDRIVDVNQGQIWVTIEPDADRDRTVESITEQMTAVPDLSSEVLTYTDARARAVLHEDEQDVVVRVYGEDAAVLDAKAGEIRDEIARLPGVASADVAASPEESTVEVRVNLAQAQALGIKPGDVRRAAASLLGGITVGNLFEEQKVFDVVVWGAPSVRQGVEDLRNLLIDIPGGGRIRLGAVAEVQEVPNDAVIRHESVARYVELTADVSGRDVGDVTADVEALVAATEFPLDHHAEVLDGYAERQAQRGELLAVAVAALVAILLLLQAAFRGWRLAAIGLLVLPVTITGGLVAVLLTGGVVRLGSVAGILVGVGLAARGLVSLVRRCEYLQVAEATDVDAAVRRAVKDRLLPTVQSVLGSLALVLPILVLGGRAGLEILHPAAVALVGVLVTATVINLGAVPALYLWFGRGADSDSWVDELLDELPPPRAATSTGTPGAVPVGG